MQLVPDVACLLSPSPPPTAGSVDRSPVSPRVVFKPLEKSQHVYFSTYLSKIALKEMSKFAFSLISLIQSLGTDALLNGCFGWFDSPEISFLV